MTLDETLHYLDTTSRVSCPSITCEQAAEIAALLRSEESPLVNRLLKKWLEEANRDRGELTKQVYKLQHNINLLEDDTELQQQESENLQQVACGFAWDAGRRMEEVLRGESFYRGKIRSLDCTFGEISIDCVYCPPSNPCLTCRTEGAGGIACGFAWDCGREIEREFARAERLRVRIDARDRELTIHEANEARRSRCGCTCCEGWNDIEATGNFDAGIYEGTGKGFEK